MTLLDLATLIAAGIGPTQARMFLAPLNAELAAWGISTPERMALFIAQASYESGGFAKLEEDLYYRTAGRAARLFRTAFDANKDRVISDEEIQLAEPYMRNPKRLANKVYANRNGNGNEQSGDGWTYRGRGFGVTGRDNYYHAGVGCGQPYEELPELVALPAGACKSFCWYWVVNRCNTLADKADCDGVTRKINPGMAGADGRRLLYAEARRAFHLTP